MGRHKAYDIKELVRKATDTFWEKGYINTSLQDLEKATGVNKSGLYSEFKDKGDLMSACLTQYTQNIGIFEQLSNKPLGWNNIRKFIYHIQTNSKRGCFVINSIAEFGALPKKSKLILRFHLNHLYDAIAENLHAEHIAKNKVPILVDIIYAFYSGMALKSNLGELSDIEIQVDSFLSAIKR